MHNDNVFFFLNDENDVMRKESVGYHFYHRRFLLHFLTHIIDKNQSTTAVGNRLR